MKLYFITSNTHKFSEAIKKLEPDGIEIEQLKLDYPEIQADTNEDIMSYGMEWIIEYYGDKIDQPFIIEDAGLFVHSLNNFPGVYSKFVYKTIGPQGILDLLAMKNNDEDRVAHFEACLGYYDPTDPDSNKKPKILKGICNGIIATKVRGTRGFGYDPIFMPVSTDSTFGEMSVEDKNQYSHRSRVLGKLRDYLTETGKIVNK